MRICFVDYDGVMTSIQEGSYFPVDVSKYKISMSCASKLVQLCKKCNAKVVVSSNWRKFDKDGYWQHNGNKYYNPLQTFIDVIREVYMCTLSPMRHVAKSFAVASWIENNKQHIDNFVVFDDDLTERFQDIDEYNIKDHFILVDRQVGLTDLDCQKATDILCKDFSAC